MRVRSRLTPSTWTDREPLRESGATPGVPDTSHGPDDRPSNASPPPAARIRLRPALLSSTVAAALVAVSVVGFLLTSHSAGQQETQLLQSETDQAATYASSALTALLGSLSSDAAVVTLSHGTPAVFDRTVSGSSTLSTVLAKKTGGSYVVTAARGPGFHPAEVLSGDALVTAKEAGRELTAGPARFRGTDTTARFAIGPPSTPAGLVIYEQVTYDPFEIVPLIAGRAFGELDLVLYAGTKADPHDLAVASTHDAQLSGQVAHADVKLGASSWLLEATARRSLIGGVAEATPYIILVLGLLMALVAGTALEVIQRRHRYANALVDQRTRDLKQSLQELRSAQEALVRGERLTAVGEMASIVSHELRNPLAAVVNALYLIRAELGEPLSDVVSRNLAMAETEAHKAASLADDLTQFVRPREMEATAVDAAGIIEEVLAASPPPAGTEVVVDVEPFTLAADRRQLSEIVTNLVVNAYQAAPGGTVRITLRAEGNAARLVVQDDGPGIAEAVAGRLFEPFVTTKHSGTGLGLAIVQRLVAAHGGEVRCENLETRGARFTVLLPQEAAVVTA